MHGSKRHVVGSGKLHISFERSLSPKFIDSSGNLVEIFGKEPEEKSHAPTATVRGSDTSRRGAQLARTPRVLRA